MIEKTFEDLIGGDGAHKRVTGERLKGLRTILFGCRKKADAPVRFTQGDYDFLAKELPTVIAVLLTDRDMLIEAHKLNAQRIAELEKRLDEVKAIRYRKTYEAGQVYKQNDCVTHSGSMWICTAAETSGVPGYSSDWTLSVKRGRDGKGS